MSRVLFANTQVTCCRHSVFLSRLPTWNECFNDPVLGTLSRSEIMRLVKSLVEASKVLGPSGAGTVVASSVEDSVSNGLANCVQHCMLCGGKLRAALLHSGIPRRRQTEVTHLLTKWGAEDDVLLRPIQTQEPAGHLAGS